MLIDSHCHLNFPDLINRLPEILNNMSTAQVSQALAISVSRESFREVLQLAEQHPNIFATIGVHPDRQDASEFSIDEMVEHAQHPKVVGIGETGLDYHWCQGDLSWQHQRFINHIQAANLSQLPLIVHTRDAQSDTIDLLKHHQAHAGVIHCFTENIDFAKKALDLGFYISFSGIVTFKNAQIIQEACRYVPLDRMLVETDSPYLAPVPKRGKVNEPAWVRYTAEFIANLRGIDLATLAHTTSENFYRLFTKVPQNTN